MLIEKMSNVALDQIIFGENKRNASLVIFVILTGDSLKDGII